MVNACENKSMDDDENVSKIEFEKVIEELNAIDPNDSYNKERKEKSLTSCFENQKNYMGFKGRVKKVTQYITKQDSLLSSKPVLSFYKSCDTAGREDMYVSYDDSGKIEYYNKYFYNSDSCFVEEFQYSNNDSLLYRERSFFLANGIKYKVVYFNDSLKVQYGYEKKYDKNMNHIGTIYFRTDGNPNYVNKIIYNKNGMILEENSYSRSGNITNLEKYTYNSDGNLGTIIHSISKEPNFKIVYDYDKTGNTFSTYSYNLIDGERLLSKNIFNYNRKLIESVEYNDNGTFKSKSKIQYDKDGKKYGYAYYDEDDKLINKEIFYDLSFDEFGNWTKMLIFNFEGNIEIYDREFEYY